MVDIARLKTLISLLQPLADLAPELERIQSAEQAVREAESAAARIQKDNLEQMQVAASVRDEIAAARDALRRQESDVLDRCKAATDSAAARAEAMLAEAQRKADAMLSDARRDADAAHREAATIRGTIADKTAEVARLDKKLAGIREQLKKMTEI